MAFAISAYFPLGFYQGSDSGGRPESYPSPNRLYSALVSTAYLTFGFEKNEVDCGLTDAQIHDALAWFEGNPPQKILFPRCIKAESKAIAYRNKGNVQNEKKPKDKVSPSAAYIATAYEQHPESGVLLTWIWHENPASAVSKTLDLLCAEVPYLGEACSAVRLETHENYDLPNGVEKQVWTLSSDSPLKAIRKGGRSVSYPKEGRLDDLKQAFTAANPQPKGKKKLSVRGKEEEQNFLNEYKPLQTEGKARYLSSAVQDTGKNTLKAPWAIGFYLEIEQVEGKQEQDDQVRWEPRESEFVGWAVALHRFLVKQWGADPARALVGKYASDMKRPANNVSIQIIDSDFKRQYDERIREDIAKLSPGFLILLPDDMPKDDVQKLWDTCNRVKGKSLYCASGKPTLRLGRVTMFDAEHFWRPAIEGMCRYWTIRPMAIAETRPIPDARQHRRWGVYEALCLALGHVWRSQYPQSSEGSREERYWSVVDAVKMKASHFRIYSSHAVHRVNMTDYAHHLGASNILHGMNALIAISDAADSLDCAAMAIGQSRHLGGGFLVPVDLPASSVQQDEDFGKGVPTWLR